MKKGQIKTGFLSMAGGILMTIFISACNDSSQSSTSDSKEVAAKDTTATTATVTKKKGKASLSAATANANAAKIEKDKERGVPKFLFSENLFPAQSSPVSQKALNKVAPQSR